MLELRSVRLIQWYHFSDVTLSIDGSCLLLGDNGSGKSTVLDAIQLGLVGDLSEVRFNKAANEHSKRTAYTYVRHKLGAENASEIRYERGSCTGYVILEFADRNPELAERPDGRFCAGVAMDVYEHDTSIVKGHCLVANVRASQIPTVTDGRGVRPTKEFRIALRAIGGEYLNDVALYRNKLRQRLGPVPESFHRLIAKGLEFKPMGHIRDFVTNYLAEPEAIQTGPLLENLNHYKTMEQEAAHAEQRIAALNEICDRGRTLQETVRTLRSHEYMSLRAELEVREDEV